MGYVSPRPGRMGKERQLIFGDAGSGKSDAILCVAKRLPDVQFRILEIDWAPSAEVLLQSERFEGVDNVEARWVYPNEWEDQLAGVQWLRDTTKPDDWAAVDSITHTWSAVEEWFIEKVFGEDPNEFFIRRRIETGGNAGDLDGWKDWGKIKKEHNRIYNGIARIQGHVIMTAEQAALGDTGEKKDDRAMFAKFGFRPGGRKQVAHVPLTVAHLSRNTSGVQSLRTFKDRGRQLVTGREITDYWADYMVAVAGWKFAAAGAGS